MDIPSDLNVVNSIAIDNIIDKIAGRDVVVSGNDIIEQDKAIIPVGPQLDKALGGGFLEGTSALIAGPPRCGKTLTSLHFAANAQKVEYGTRPVLYLSAEARLESRDVRGIKHLKPDLLTVIRASEDQMLYAEDWFQIARNFLMNHKKGVLIVDSFSSMVPRAEFENEFGKATYGKGNQLNSAFTKQMGQIIMARNHIVIGIVHLTTNVSGYGKKYLEKGGLGIQYQLQTKIVGDQVKFRYPGGVELDDGDSKKDLQKAAIGQSVRWTVERTPLGPPNQQVISKLLYGTGIDEVLENIDIGIELGVVKKGGAWYTVAFGDNAEDIKLQGMDNLIEYVNSEPNVYDLLKGKISEFLDESDGA